MLILLLAVLVGIPVATTMQSGGSVSGIVRTADNRPLEGVRVALRPAGANEKKNILISISQTDGTGRYSLADVPPGRYYVSLGGVATPLYYPGIASVAGATIVAVTAGTMTELPAISLPKPQRLAGRVVDADSGQPVMADRIVVCSDPNCIQGRVDQRVIAATLGPGGTFEFPDLVPGEYSLRVNGPDVVAFAQAVSINSGFGPAPLELRLTRGVSLSGDVVDSAGRPSSFVELSLQVKGSAGTARTISPGADGAFAFSRLAPGTYVLGTRSPWFPGSEQEVEIGKEGLSGVRIASPFIEFGGRAEMDDGSSLPADFVARIGVAHFVNPGTRRYTVSVDAAGRFGAAVVPGELQLSIEYLPPGYSLVSLQLGEIDLTKQELDLRAPVSGEIILRLRR